MNVNYLTRKNFFFEVNILRNMKKGVDNITNI